MGYSYQLKYWISDLKSGKSLAKCIKARAIQYETNSSDPMEQRYFCGVEEGMPKRCICFIKRFVTDKNRYQLERSAARISSPYVAAPYTFPQMKRCRMEYCDNGTWRALKGKIILYEYLPCDLTAFRNGYTDGRKMPDVYQRDILLKLIQAVGHVHQARIIHHDIKPGNILINCQGLCEEAPWNREELDVKLTDFDGIYDADSGAPQLHVGTEPFQPQCKIPPSVWLDIYSLCMVALWLYDSQGIYLSVINRKLPETESEIEEIMEDCRTAVPEHIRQILVPHLLRAISKMKGSPDASQWTAGAKELSELYQELSSVFVKGWQPAELLGPAQASTAWSAVVQVDQELWPVYGQDREYRALPIMSEVSGGDVGNGAGSGRLELSAPPVVFVAGDQADNGVWTLKAGIYGSLNQQGWRLAQKEHMSEGEDVQLYRGTPVCVSGSRGALFQDIAIRAVHFCSEKERPTALPLFRSQDLQETADINLVFAMTASGAADESSGAACRLVRHVTDEMSKLVGCNTRYYGITMRLGDENLYSFCSGLRNPSGDELCELYSGSTYRARDVQNGVVFDPGLPTIVIGYLDHLPDQSTDIVRRLTEGIHLYFQYAVQYLQIFTANQLNLTEDMGELLPCLAAAVEPDGACILTPLSGGDGFPDPKARWLAAVRYWYQSSAVKCRGEK